MRKSGFSLIELLVVIGIIAILSVLAVPNFLGARQKARDVQRKNDLKQIQNALELYKNDQASPQYPNSLPAKGQPFTSADGKTVYMKSFPGDPDSATPYTYTRLTNLTYTFSACLENKADPQGAACDGGSIDQGGGEGDLGPGPGPVPGPGGSCVSNLCYSITEP